MATQDIFIRLEGIDGESKNAKHKGWIDVLNFSYSVANSSVASAGGEGHGTGRASFDALSFTHWVDRASPNLFTYCASGKHINKVELAVCKTTGDKEGSVEYLKIELEKVVVTHVSPSASVDQLQVPETVSLSYNKITIKICEQDAYGSMKPVVEGGWNVKGNSRT